MIASSANIFDFSLEARCGGVKPAESGAFLYITDSA
jgi:hypothetical protein